MIINLAHPWEIGDVGAPVTATDYTPTVNIGEVEVNCIKERSSHHKSDWHVAEPEKKDLHCNVLTHNHGIPC